MSKSTKQLLTVLIASLAAPMALAQSPDDGSEFRVHDRERGELSPGTHAPTRAEMMATIQSASRNSPEQLQSILEYGERVECHACVPLLEANLLGAGNADVRRISAWWLRRRPFAIGMVMRSMRMTLQNDSDPVRRARAAEAIGEFLDPNGFAPLSSAAMEDGEGVVRNAAVRALGRLNHPAGGAIIAAALSDSDATVRLAAVDQVLKLNFFREHDALIGTLADDNREIRMRSARLLGEFRVAAAVPALAGLLRGDEEVSVRQAAAWALGRINGTEARAALRDAAEAEESTRVQDAINVAMRMRAQ